jgi:hypothetical protein
MNIGHVNCVQTAVPHPRAGTRDLREGPLPRAPCKEARETQVKSQCRRSIPAPASGMNVAPVAKEDAKLGVELPLPPLHSTTYDPVDWWGVIGQVSVRNG